MSTNKIRTRYAPSPTGFFHVGGARTALFCYLFAKHNGGDFILRIEDTDEQRNVEKGVESQYENLMWLGLKPDESIKNPGKCGPYIQSMKYDRYKELAYQLVKQNKAYYCFCSKEELESQRQEAIKNKLTPKYNRKCLGLTQQEIDKNLSLNKPFVIRLKTPEGIYQWNDLIRGQIEVPSSALTDPVLLKANNTPMYNFAVVIDDYDMDITHVLRGEEHLSNTPYQIAIKKALGFDSKFIQYGHLPIIIDETGKKLSKRNQTLKQFIEDYRNMGFLQEAINNFLGLIGWSPKAPIEIMDMATMVSLFDLTHISKAPATFDFNKMLWIAKEHMQKLDDNTYINFVKKFITFDKDIFKDKINEVLLLFKKQISYAQQINDLVHSTFLSNTYIKNIDPKILNSLKQNIIAQNNLLPEVASLILKNIQNETQLKGKDLYMPIRLLLTGHEHGPELNKIMSILGKEKILEIIA